MADRTNFPTREDLQKIFEKLLPPNEEMDEVSASFILDRAGVDRAKFAEGLRLRLESKVEEMRGRGEVVPQALVDTLALFEPAVEQESQSTEDPKEWIRSMLQGRLPGNVAGLSQLAQAQAFRSLRREMLNQEDVRILDDIVIALQARAAEMEE